MQLPLLIFTDSIPTSWQATAAFAGAGSFAADSAIRTAPNASASLPGAGTLVAPVGVVARTNPAALPGSGFFYAPVGLQTIDNPVVLIGDGFLYTLTQVKTLWIGMPLTGEGSLTVAETHIIPQVYNITPEGGVRWGGSALVQESIPYLPTGGSVWGGAASVQELIPHKPTGGVVWSGTAPPLVAFTITPTGGNVWGGTAPINAKYAVETPAGGFVWGGTSPVTTYSAWHQPTGGVVWGGAAVAYSETADYFATTENPLNEPFFGWAMNAETGTPTRYYRLPATSMCQHDGITYVTTAAGIYEYGAEDDAGQHIRASVQFPKTDFATGLTKRMEVAYFGVKSPERLRLKVMANADDPRYYLIQPSGDDPKGTRVPIGKGMAGRYWSMRLDNVAGSDFELDSAEFLPVRSHHRHGA